METQQRNFDPTLTTQPEENTPNKKDHKMHVCHWQNGQDCLLTQVWRLG